MSVRLIGVGNCRGKGAVRRETYPSHFLSKGNFLQVFSGRNPNKGQACFSRAVSLEKGGRTFLKKGFSLPSPNPIPPSPKTFEIIESLFRERAAHRGWGIAGARCGSQGSASLSFSQQRRLSSSLFRKESQQRASLLFKGGELGKGGRTFLKKGFSLPSPTPIPPSPKTFEFIESLFRERAAHRGWGIAGARCGSQGSASLSFSQQRRLSSSFFRKESQQRASLLFKGGELGKEEPF